MAKEGRMTDDIIPESNGEALIAAWLDHPSVYMGGPSEASKRKARSLLKHLVESGFVLVPVPDSVVLRDGFDRDGNHLKVTVSPEIAALLGHDAKPAPSPEDTETDAYFRSAARDQYAADGEIEIDADAVVSVSDEGAYVAAWVWVSNADVGLDVEGGAEEQDRESYTDDQDRGSYPTS